MAITTDKLPVYLLAYCSADPKSSVERANPINTTQDEADALAAIKRHGNTGILSTFMRCPHNTDMDYSEEMVKQVMLAGMYDDEIKRKVLSTSKD